MQVFGDESPNPVSSLVSLLDDASRRDRQTTCVRLTNRERRNIPTNVLRELRRALKLHSMAVVKSAILSSNVVVPDVFIESCCKGYADVANIFLPVCAGLKSTDLYKALYGAACNHHTKIMEALIVIGTPYINAQIYPYYATQIMGVIRKHKALVLSLVDFVDNSQDNPRFDPRSFLNLDKKIQKIVSDQKQAMHVCLYQKCAIPHVLADIIVDYCYF